MKKKTTTIMLTRAMIFCNRTPPLSSDWGVPEWAKDGYGNLPTYEHGFERCDDVKMVYDKEEEDGEVNANTEDEFARLIRESRERAEASRAQARESLARVELMKAEAKRLAIEREKNDKWFRGLWEQLQATLTDLKGMHAASPLESVPTAQIEEDSPPVWSPVTFSGLLPAVVTGGLTARELRLIVVALALPAPPVRSSASVGIGAKAFLSGPAEWPPQFQMRGPRVTGLAGTDTRGFRLPPDRPDGFGRVVGTDVRGFRLPPDLVAGGGRDAKCEMDRLRMHAIKGVSARTDERRFRRPPDPMVMVLGDYKISSEMAGRRCRDSGRLPTGDGSKTKTAWDEIETWQARFLVYGLGYLPQTLPTNPF